MSATTDLNNCNNLRGHFPLRADVRGLRQSSRWLFRLYCLGGFNMPA